MSPITIEPALRHAFAGIIASYKEDVEFKKCRFIEAVVRDLMVLTPSLNVEDVEEMVSWWLKSTSSSPKDYSDSKTKDDRTIVYKYTFPPSSFVSRSSPEAYVNSGNSVYSNNSSSPVLFTSQPPASEDLLRPFPTVPRPHCQTEYISSYDPYIV